MKLWKVYWVRLVHWVALQMPACELTLTLWWQVSRKCWQEAGRVSGYLLCYPTTVPAYRVDGTLVKRAILVYLPKRDTMEPWGERADFATQLHGGTILIWVPLPIVSSTICGGDGVTWNFCSWMRAMQLPLPKAYPKCLLDELPCLLTAGSPPGVPVTNWSLHQWS